MSHASDIFGTGASQAPWNSSYRGDFLRRLGGRIANYFRQWLTWRDRERAIRHLRKLDDRLLSDIGLDRSQVEQAVLTGRK